MWIKDVGGGGDGDDDREPSQVVGQDRWKSGGRDQANAYRQETKWKRERERKGASCCLSLLFVPFFLSFFPSSSSRSSSSCTWRERERTRRRATDWEKRNEQRKKERDEGWLEVEIERREGYNLDARVRPGIQTPPSLSRQKLSKRWWKQEEENQKASLCACREFLLSQRLFPSSTQGKKERNILYMHARSLSLLFLSQ